jgi:ATP-dependent Lhr-like helicase
MEARGELRGGRFVAGFSGEQYALPEAVGLLRQLRREPPRRELVAVSAADPLNLAGVIAPGDRVPAHSHVRVLLCDGVPVAAQDGTDVQIFTPELPLEEERTLRAALAPRRISPVLRTYLGV